MAATWKRQPDGSWERRLEDGRTLWAFHLEHFAWRGGVRDESGAERQPEDRSKLAVLKAGLDAWAVRHGSLAIALPPLAPACVHCGEPGKLELFEIWSGHEFQIATCCHGLWEEVVAEMAADPVWASSLLRRLGAEVLTGQRLRRVADAQAGGLLLDWQLQIRPVRFAAARAFIVRHHAHCPPPVAWRFGASCWNGPSLLGVVTVGNPVARAFNHRGIVEVNRLCVRRDVAPALRWNAASMLYGHAARTAERVGFARIITYTREDEDGTSLRAAGCCHEGPAGGGWHSAARPRGNRNTFVCKVRWSRTLHPRMAPKPPRGIAPTVESLWIGDRPGSAVCSP